MVVTMLSSYKYDVCKYACMYICMYLRTHDLNSQRGFFRTPRTPHRFNKFIVGGFKIDEEFLKASGYMPIIIPLDRRFRKGVMAR